VGRSRLIDEDFWFQTALYFVIACVSVFVLLPLLNVLSSSFSSPALVAQGQVLFWPQEWTLQSYGKVLENKEVWRGYGNTLYYTIVGTAVNMLLTTLAAYPLSRSDLKGSKLILGLLIFLMYFQGGLIPTYLVVKNLGLVNTVWAMVLPHAINTFNLIVMRTYFISTLPKELQEAAFMDGCSNTRYLWSVVIPVCKPILAVIALYYSVYHWNDFFQALIYLNDKKMYPLQLVLRDILISSKVDDFATLDEGYADRLFQAEGIKYAIIVVASLPMLIFYPFLQKYFVTGALVGSVKG
jgi:putative aldouronate transport system permease protein